MLQRLGLVPSSEAKKKRRVKVSVPPGGSVGFRYEWHDGLGVDGPRVTDVAKGGAAEQGGVRPGDVVLKVGGYRVPTGAHLLRRVEEMKRCGGVFELLLLSSSPGGNPGVAGFAPSLVKPLLKNTFGGTRDRPLQSPPRTIEVVCPKQGEVEGTFRWSGERANGAPVWSGRGGQRLYCTRSGLWALVDVADGPAKNIALVSSRTPARGRLPHELHWGEWQCWAPTEDAWMACPVRIEELRVDPADGRPYWRGAFIEYYGASLGDLKWRQLEPADPSSSSSSSSAFDDDDTGSSAASSSAIRRASTTADDSTQCCDDDSDSCLSLQHTSSYVPPDISMVMEG